MHMRSYFLAKQHLEQVGGFVVLGSLLSCAHSSTVRERYRFHPSEIIPSPHRLAIAQLLVQESKWLSIEPWEITRRRAMDYISLLDHTAATLNEHFNGIEFNVIYLCKGNMIPKISPLALRNGNYGVVCVCRPPESDQIKESLSAKWNGIMWVAEDTAILDNSMDVVSSRKVRDKIKNNENISQYLGDSVQSYIRAHHLHLKMKGEELWTDEERKLPKISSRPYEFTFEHTLRSQVLSENNNSKTVDSVVFPADNDDVTVNSAMSDITFR
jgi:nicotinic acid mononucleotide adenylyltransferase